MTDINKLFGNLEHQQLDFSEFKVIADVQLDGSQVDGCLYFDLRWESFFLWKRDFNRFIRDDIYSRLAQNQNTTKQKNLRKDKKKLNDPPFSTLQRRVVETYIGLLFIWFSSSFVNGLIRNAFYSPRIITKHPSQKTKKRKHLKPRFLQAFNSVIVNKLIVWETVGVVWAWSLMLTLVAIQGLLILFLRLFGV